MQRVSQLTTLRTNWLLSGGSQAWDMEGAGWWGYGGGCCKARGVYGGGGV